ncbi:hypothetical protein O181_083226, partial [Austropuccinia psidii MF-1]|nr:hypothetical protein [Austropuccinia psidii MF-1]
IPNNLTNPNIQSNSQQHNQNGKRIRSSNSNNKKSSLNNQLENSISSPSIGSSSTLPSSNLSTKANVNSSNSTIGHHFGNNKKKRSKQGRESSSPLVLTATLAPESQNPNTDNRSNSISISHPTIQAQSNLTSSSSNPDVSTSNPPTTSSSDPMLNSRKSIVSTDLQQSSLSQDLNSTHDPISDPTAQPATRHINGSNPTGSNLENIDSITPTLSPSPSLITHLGQPQNPSVSQMSSRAVTPSNSIGRTFNSISNTTGSPLKESYQNPNRYTNNRIEYTPICKPADCLGGWDLREADEVYHHSMAARPRRSLDDLGLVDVHSLVMSLKSRIASEVTYALNTLTMIGPHLKLYRDDNSGNFGVLSMPLMMCEDLLDELLDLLEDVGFESEKKNAIKKETDEENLLLAQEDEETFQSMMVNALDEESKPLVELTASYDELEDPHEVKDSSLRPRLGRVELVFSILNILRCFGMTEESGTFIGRNPRTARLLIGLCQFSHFQVLKSNLRLTKLERLRIRREVLQILADVSHGIDLNQQSNQTVMVIMRLALFFLSNSPNQIDRTAYGGGELGEGLGTLKPGQELSPATLVRLRSLSMVPSHVDTGLSLISKIATLDGNRKKIEESTRQTELRWILERLLEVLMKLIPITEEEILLVVSEEEARIRAEILAMALFNIVNLQSGSKNLDVRSNQNLILMKTLVKTITRFLASGGDDQISILISMKMNLTQIFIERLVETLKLIFEQGQIGNKKIGFTKMTNERNLKGMEIMSWFGGGFESGENKKEIGESLICEGENLELIIKGEKGLRLPSLLNLKNFENEFQFKHQDSMLEGNGLFGWKNELIKILIGSGNLDLNHSNSNSNETQHHNLQHQFFNSNQLISSTLFNSLTKLLSD